MTALEIAVQDAASIAIAARAGADRIELCSALAVGGVTPSQGLIELATSHDLPVHALVRPRDGGFEFDGTEKQLMLDDIRVATEALVDGVVVGALIDGRVDRDFVAAAVDAAAGIDVTFHRAFDAVPDRMRALDELIELGVRRILTSGGADRAVDALDGVRELVRRADGAIEVMAGGGIAPDNAAAVVATGVDAVHASARRSIVEEIPVRLGSASPGGRVVRDTLDEEVVRRLVAVVRSPAGAP